MFSVLVQGKPWVDLKVVPNSSCGNSDVGGRTGGGPGMGDLVTGHQAVALICLDEAEAARRLQGVFGPGSRSVMFRFPEVARSQAASHGALGQNWSGGIGGKGGAAASNTRVHRRQGYTSPEAIL